MDDPTYINAHFFHKLKFFGNRAVIDWCRSIGLLATEYKCPECSELMKMTERKDLTDGFEWRCRLRHSANDIKRSIRTGSYFSSSRLSITEILLITYYWVHKIPSDFITFELKTCSATIADWRHFCKEICVDICEKESVQVGGNNSIVEVFMGKFGEYKKGRNKRVTGRWAYGGLLKGSCDFFFKVVNYPAKEEFLHAIEECVLPHTIVVSECCSSYKCSKDESFQQVTKTHNIRFRAHDPHANYFLKPKRKRGVVRIIDKKDFSGYALAEYLWQKKHGTNSMLSFLNHVKEMYPPETEDSYSIITENKV